jgi:integrase/recombinase XerD
LYLAVLRADQAAMTDRADVHFGRGPFGKLHVRFGKSANTSGPRPRWVPMLDGLDLILRWYLDEIQPRMGDGPALFCDEGGGRIHRGAIRNRLASLLEMEQAAAQSRGRHGALSRFSPHTLRTLVASWVSLRRTHSLRRRTGKSARGPSHRQQVATPSVCGCGSGTWRCTRTAPQCGCRRH